MNANQAFEMAAASLEATAADFDQIARQLVHSYCVNMPPKITREIRDLEAKAQLLRGQAGHIRAMKADYRR